MPRERKLTKHSILNALWRNMTIKAAAEDLGVNRDTLYEGLRHFGIDKSPLYRGFGANKSAFPADIKPELPEVAQPPEVTEPVEDGRPLGEEETTRQALGLLPRNAQDPTDSPCPTALNPDTTKSALRLTASDSSARQHTQSLKEQIMRKAAAAYGGSPNRGDVGSLGPRDLEERFWAKYRKAKS